MTQRRLDADAIVQLPATVFPYDSADLLGAITDNCRLGEYQNENRCDMVNRESTDLNDLSMTGSAQAVLSRRNPWPAQLRALVAALAACASLAGCASTSDVAATGKPGTYTVAASATGGRMAWARAHEHAISEARDYCEQRGMQTSVMDETVSGVQTMETHASSVNFECHPKF
jgi:uncharacterized protein YceK